MKPLPRFTCSLFVVVETPDGRLATSHVQVNSTEIQQRFKASLEEDTLVMHALRRASAQVAAHAPEPVAPARPLEDVFLDEVETLISRRLSEPQFGVEKLASEMAMSPRHLHRKLTDLTGESPQTLLRRKRVERAEMLLRSGAPCVKEVAYAVGYGSGEGLRRAFVAVRGTPPSALLQS